MLPTHIIIFIDDDEVNGPGICRRLSLRRGNCWDGDSRRDDDIDEFDADNIDGQGTIKIIDNSYAKLDTHSRIIPTHTMSY